MRISNEVANAIRESLAAEPPREAHRSRAALIRDLAPELIKARKDKNLSLDDLRAILQKSGLEISVGTLKNYLSQSRRPAREIRLGAAAARPKAKPEDGSMPQLKTRADKPLGAPSEERRPAPRPGTVNRRPKLTPDRRSKLTPCLVVARNGSARPGGAGRGCAAGASAGRFAV